MKKQTTADKLKQSISEHNKSYERWEHLNINGGSDPTWSDGCNMGLVRNHIIGYKMRIKEYCEELNQPLPEEYHRELPPEVDYDYMARAEEIRKNAKLSLEIYKRDKNYLELLRIVGTLNKKQAESISIHNVIGYVTGLERFIQEDDLIAMRRHEHPEIYLSSFAGCRENAEKLSIEPVVFIPQQIDLFSLI